LLILARGDDGEKLADVGSGDSFAPGAAATACPGGGNVPATVAA
jgi:hypothetical protein